MGKGPFLITFPFAFKKRFQSFSCIVWLCGLLIYSLLPMNLPQEEEEVVVELVFTRSSK